MSDHIPEASKMVSDTPRTDAAYFRPHATMYDLAGEMKRLERELNAAREISNKYEDRYFAALNYIKRLEEAGDKLFELCDATEHQFHLADEIPQRLEAWTTAKEAKP